MSKPIFTLSSSKHVEVLGSGSSAYVPPVNVEGWNSLSVTRTTSFSTIQKEVISSVSFDNKPTYQAFSPVEEANEFLYSGLIGPKRSSSRPGVPTGGNGETPPATGQLLPVGDMLLPMLVIALGYIVVKLFRNRKTSQAL
jgi:hypothetical protein